MNEDEIRLLVHMNERLLLVMRFATSVVLKLGHYVPEEKKEGIYWFVEVMENIVYLDKPLPPFPER